jgi:hypothetical protein
LGVITLKPEATSMLSLFWVLLVVVQPTVNANRAMTLSMLNEVCICFIILGSFQVAVIFDLSVRWKFASTQHQSIPFWDFVRLPQRYRHSARLVCRIGNFRPSAFR